MHPIDSIAQFVMRELLSNSGIDMLADTDPLIESGIIDSFGIMSLISFIEKEFGIRISNNELVPENFENIAKIANLVENKLSEKEAKT
jgi:acyl carrier protein